MRGSLPLNGPQDEGGLPWRRNLTGESVVRLDLSHRYFNPKPSASFVMSREAETSHNIFAS
jgi:hypothetical protein